MLDFDWSFRAKAGEFIYLYNDFFLLYADGILYPSKEMHTTIYIKLLCLNIHLMLRCFGLYEVSNRYYAFNTSLILNTSIFTFMYELNLLLLKCSLIISLKIGNEHIIIN